MTTGINNMISNYTHVLFAMNPFTNDTTVLFSIEYSEGVKRFIVSMKLVMILLVLVQIN
jgi:hypothetical protein